MHVDLTEHLWRGTSSWRGLENSIFFPRFGEILLFSPRVYDLQWDFRSQLNQTHFWVDQTMQMYRCMVILRVPFPLWFTALFGLVRAHKRPLYEIWCPNLGLPNFLKPWDSKTGEPRHEVGGWCSFQKFLQHLGIDCYEGGSIWDLPGRISQPST